MTYQQIQQLLMANRSVFINGEKIHRFQGQYIHFKGGDNTSVIILPENLLTYLQTVSNGDPSVFYTI